MPRRDCKSVCFSDRLRELPRETINTFVISIAIGSSCISLRVGCYLDPGLASNWVDLTQTKKLSGRFPLQIARHSMG